MLKLVRLLYNLKNFQKINFIAIQDIVGELQLGRNWTIDKVFSINPNIFMMFCQLNNKYIYIYNPFIMKTTLFSVH